MMKCADMPFGTEFWYRGEWYRRIPELRMDGQLYNCMTINMSEPDYALLDEEYLIREGTSNGTQNNRT